MSDPQFQPNGTKFKNKKGVEWTIFGRTAEFYRIHMMEGEEIIATSVARFDQVHALIKAQQEAAATPAS